MINRKPEAGSPNMNVKSKPLSFNGFRGKLFVIKVSMPLS